MKVIRACCNYCPIKLSAFISRGYKSVDDIRDIEGEFILCEPNYCPKWIEEPCGYKNNKTKCPHYGKQDDFDDYCYECDERRGHCAG